jgi:hypothetical protein
LPRLRSRAVASNTIYQDALAVLAAQAEADMDAGHLPGDDNDGADRAEYPNEMNSQLVARWGSYPVPAPHARQRRLEIISPLPPMGAISGK